MIQSVYVREMTQEDYAELMSLFGQTGRRFTKEHQEVVKHPLNPKDKQGLSFVLAANFVFKCNTCEETGLQPWYKLIIQTIGGSPMHRSFTSFDDLRKGYGGSNLLRIIEDAELPDNVMDSGLNYLKKEGYVCDHCMDSV